MSGMALAASNFLVWIVVLLLVVAVVALARQIAILREQVAPLHARDARRGLQAGDLVPVITAPTIDGRVVTIGGANDLGRPVLLLFVETGCTICRKIVRLAMVVARAEQLTLIFAGAGQIGDFRAMQDKLRMNAHDIVNSSDIGPAYDIAKLPTAVLIRPDGTLVAMGIVSSRQQLEALVGAGRAGKARQDAVPVGLLA